MSQTVGSFWHDLFTLYYNYNVFTIEHWMWTFSLTFFEMTPPCGYMLHLHHILNVSFRHLPVLWFNALFSFFSLVYVDIPDFWFWWIIVSVICYFISFLHLLLFSCSAWASGVWCALGWAHSWRSVHNRWVTASRGCRWKVKPDPMILVKSFVFTQNLQNLSGGWSEFMWVLHQSSCRRAAHHDS